MKAPDLVQSRMFHKVKLTLEPDGIAVDESNISRSNKTLVHFESIPRRPSELTTSSKKAFTCGIVFSAIAMITLPLAFTKKADVSAPVVWGVIAGICWAIYYFSRKSFVKFVQNGAGLNLYKNNPSEQAMNDFVNKMFELRKSHLLKKYGRFLDEESFENKMARLDYLRTQGVINDEEFEVKREEFAKGRKISGPIGFSPQ